MSGMMRAQAEEVRKEKQEYIVALTVRAHRGDFEAFQERQAILFLDSIDIELQWQEFRQLQQ